jgi:hypothetical protein
LSGRGARDVPILSGGWPYSSMAICALRICRIPGTFGDRIGQIQGQRLAKRAGGPHRMDEFLFRHSAQWWHR